MGRPFIVEKISWRSVAQEVSKQTGKPYTPDYIREVATGYRRNNQLTPILRDLGFLKTKAA